MAINFFDPEIFVQSGPTSARILDGSQPDGGTDEDGDIPTTEDLTGIELRLLPPFIKNNRTPRIPPFPGLAKLYCLTIVVSDAENDLIGGIDLQGFPRIGDNEHLPINKTIFYWQQDENSKKPPSQLHIMCCVMKSKSGLRDTGKILASIKNDEEYKNIITSLAGLVTKASPPGAIVTAITSLASVVGRLLENVQDKPLATTVNSFTALDGSFDKEGVFKNLFATKNVNFEFSLIVRDKNKEDAMTADIVGNKSLNAVTEVATEIKEDQKVLVELSPF
jgi:hypothetical protein